MSFGEFYTAFSGLGDAFKEGADKAEAARLLDQQLTAALATQQLQAAQPAALAALGQSPVAAPKVPAFAGGSTPMRLPSGNTDIENKFVGALKEGGLTNPYGLAAAAAYGRRESGYAPDKIGGSWSDPSQSGQAGTSGGILSWRNERLNNMRRSTAGATDPVTAQAKFFLTEDANTTLALQNAKSAEEANDILAKAWRFAGYNSPGGEYAARLGTTRAYLARLGGEQSAATRVADASQGMPPSASGLNPDAARRPAPAPQQVVQAGDNPADLPAPNAQPVEFRIPGQEQPSDFVPGSVASPAVQGGNPQIAAGGQALAPAAAQRLSPDQVTNLRAMLRNPNTQGYAAKIIEGLNKPSEFSFQVVGDQLIRTSKDGRAEVVPNITKPPTFDTVKDDNGNIQVFNKATGQITRGLPGQDKSVRDLTPAEKQARGIEANVFAQVDANGNVMFPGKPANVVNLDQKQEGAFAGEAGKGIASRFQKISDEGDAGRTELALVGQLKSLADQIGTGAGAAATARLAEYGVKVGPNVGKIEAYQSLVDKLTPSQRLPGAGATSDFDAKLFKSSLPRLINTPEGNALISSTLEALAKDKVSRAEIADMALIGPSQGGISTAEAVKRLRALPPPNLVLQSGLTELQKAGKLGAMPPVQAEPPKASGLNIGGSTVIDGVTIKRVR